MIQKYILILSFGCAAFYLSWNILKIWFAQKKWIYLFWSEHKKQKALYQALPSLLLQLSSFLQSGHALPSALTQLSQSKLGFLFYHYLKSPSKDFLFHEFLFLNTCFSLSTKNGISLSYLLRNISHLIQTQIQTKEKIKILTFPMKAQAYIAILLPWFTLFIFGIIAPSLITEALHSPWGVVGFSTALVLEVLGLIWIKKI